VRPMAERDIRLSMVNCSRSEVAKLTLPRELDALAWDDLDFLGWRDPRAPLRGYLVQWREDRPVGVQLRAAESTMSRKVAAVCLLCRSGRSGDSVSLFTARRAGPAGRDGNTVGTYICADLTCSRNVRIEAPSAQIQPDPGLSTEQRIAGLRTRLGAFLDEVLREQRAG
jgi:hypothetical protein